MSNTFLHIPGFLLPTQPHFLQVAPAICFDPISHIENLPWVSGRPWLSHNVLSRGNESQSEILRLRVGLVDAELH